MLVDAFGCRWTLDVRGLGDELAGDLEHLWDRARVTPAVEHDAPPFVVTRAEDGAFVLDGARHRVPLPELPYALSRAVTLASIRRRSGECLMLHAAGLAAPDGATVALVAASGTGKTTAGATLGRRLGYVSDETVGVEADLTVRAYPKPLSVVVDGDAPGSKSEHSPDDLALVRAPADLRLAATVVIEREPGRVEPLLEPLGLLEAAGLVLPQTSALPSLDRPLDRLAHVLAAGHGPWRLRYGEIADCAGLVTALAAGETPGGVPEEVAWEWVDGRPRPDPGPSTVTDPTTDSVVERSPFDDALVSDGSALVLRRRVPSSLPGLAGTLWHLVDRPTTVADLVDAASEALGPHPDATALVLDTVRVLHDGGLVVLR